MVDYRIGNQHASLYKALTVTRTTYGSVSDGYVYDFLIPFCVQGFSVALESTSTCSISFDGYSTHIFLDSTQSSKTQIFENRNPGSKVWLAVNSGSPATIKFSAWSIP